jgi:hypothetical protein
MKVEIFLNKKEKELMAQRIIYVKRYFVNQQIMKNLQSFLENKRKHGISAISSDRYCIQFDPKTGQYGSCVESGTEMKIIDLHPGWRWTAFPIPHSELEFQNMKEAIASGTSPFMTSEGPDYRLEVID